MPIRITGSLRYTPTSESPVKLRYLLHFFAPISEFFRRSLFRVIPSTLRKAGLFIHSTALLAPEKPQKRFVIDTIAKFLLSFI